MFDLKADIERGLRKYPSLKTEVISGNSVLTGTFTCANKETGVLIESYDLTITLPNGYPYCFPVVEETSRKIPQELDRHVKGDGTLCFANPYDEYSVCRKGITLTWFLDEILNAHLCREYVREKTGSYPTGERSHGNEGIWESYYEIFGTSDKKEILRQLNLIFNHPKLGRNTLCYCGSEKKYKACHEKIEPIILRPGKHIAEKIFEVLKKDYKETK
jgi:hypothetical protein